MKFKRFNDEEIELKFICEEYLFGGKCYEAYEIDKNGEIIDYYDTVTVCIPGTNLLDNEIILDTNNCEKLINALIFNGLVTLTEEVARSGYCIYPIAIVTEKMKEEIFIEHEKV